MRRTTLILTLVVVMALVNLPEVMGGGGPAPGFAGKKVTGPAVSGVLVLDPHETGDTGKARQATLRLQKGTQFSSAVFAVPSIGFPLTCGCDLKLTAKRFLNKKLTNFVPTSAIVNQLFADLGFMTPFPGGVDPIITDINNATCTADPDNPATVADPTGNTTLLNVQTTCAVPDATFPGSPPIAGVLSMEVVIQFLGPQTP